MLEAEPGSVSKARRYCEQRLADWGAGDLVDTVALLVSELVTNVVLHAGTACELRLKRGERLRVEVVDGSQRRPIRGAVPNRGELWAGTAAGRGAQRRVRHDPRAGGKTRLVRDGLGSRVSPLTQRVRSSLCLISMDGGRSSCAVCRWPAGRPWWCIATT